MRILSSAEKCRRVARRIFSTTSVADSFSGTDFCLIFAPCEGYDEPEILPSSTHPICLMSTDGGHLPRSQATKHEHDASPVANAQPNAPEVFSVQPEDFPASQHIGESSVDREPKSYPSISHRLCG